jgi:hypothetical protein
LRRPGDVCDDSPMGLSRFLARVALATCTLSVLLVLACSDDDSGNVAPPGASAAAGTSAAGGSTSTGGTAGTGGSGGGMPATPGALFLQDYASAVCSMYQPCCNADALGFDLAGCTSWFSRVSAAYVGNTFDPDLGAACLAALADAVDADPDRCSNVALFDEATFWEQCRQAFSVTREGVALGEVCDLAGDCASSPDGPVLCYGGRCLLQLDGAPGDGPCFIQGSENRPLVAYTCNATDGVFCNRGTKNCEAHVAAGEYCPYPNACDPKTAMCVGGMCTALGAEGEACVNGVQGSGGYCVPGSVCDRTTLTCGPGRAEGEACKEGECETGLCLDGTCQKSDYQRNLNCTG